jgi:hypothetical protein
MSKENEITRQQIVDLYSLLKKEYANVKSTKFAYGIAKNLKNIQDEIDFLNEMNKAPEDFIKYEIKRQDLCVQMAKKDDEGKILKKKLPNGKEAYDIEDQEKFDKSILELQEEFKDAIEEKKQKEIDMHNFLKEKVSVSIYKMSIDEFPEDLNAETMIILEPIIKDN